MRSQVLHRAAQVCLISQTQRQHVVLLLVMCQLLTLLGFASAEAPCVIAGCDKIAADTVLIDARGQHVVLLLMVYVSYVMQTLLVKTGCMHVLHGRSRNSQCYQYCNRLSRISS